MAGFRQTSCCGMLEFYGLNPNPKTTIKDFLRQRKNVTSKNLPLILFSDAVINSNGTPFKNSGGITLAKYIKENNLGTLVSKKPSKNPNSGNMIKAWLWTPNYRKINALEKKLRKTNPNLS